MLVSHDLHMRIQMVSNARGGNGFGGWFLRVDANDVTEFVREG